MRLAKYLASAGIASRRAAEALVREGRVTVEGRVITDPARDVSDETAVAVDGEAVRQPGRRVVYAVNKPAGVVSTAHDPQGRPTVVSLVPETLRLYPVGRLDADTTGLILLTNDGELAHRLTHPSFEVEKTYLATLANPPVARKAVEALRRGVELDDGLTAPAQVHRVAEDKLEIMIHEGRKRQVRRMCQAVGYSVASLERVAFGPVVLGTLRPGAHRQLRPQEVDALASAGSGARHSGAASYGVRGTRRRRSRAPDGRR